MPGDVSVFTGEKFPFDLDVAPKSVPPDARITIRNGRGDISVRASNESQIRVAGKKNANAWNETDAQRIANPISVEITQNGDAYEIHPAGTGSGNARISLDLDVSVPKKSALTIRNEKGDISGTTTTSGLAWKIAGRVGDSALIGAGLYVDNDVGAAGSTGRP